MTHKQSHDIERLFQAARQAEPDLSDSVFTDAVMHRIACKTAVAPMAAWQKKVILWCAGLLGALLAVSLFPTTELVEILTAFTGGITLPVIGSIALIAGVMSFSAYWVVEADGL